jgi:hypothetical protein
MTRFPGDARLTLSLLLPAAVIGCVVWVGQVMGWW